MRFDGRHEEERSVEAERPRGMGGLDRRNDAHQETEQSFGQSF